MTENFWLHKAEKYFLKHSVPEPAANAEFILAHVLKVSRNQVVLGHHKSLSPNQVRQFLILVRRRAQRRPLAYVLGSQPFLDFNLIVGPGALIPRPETEEVAATAIELLHAALSRRDGEESLQFLDLGTGTGCLAIALARAFPQAKIIAVDVSQAALALARQNVRAQKLGTRVRLIREDFTKPRGVCRTWADLIVSNPPYIPSGEIKRLAPEVRHEPRLALDGGKRGLKALEAVIQYSWRALKPEGLLVMEIGWKQRIQVLGLLKAQGFAAAEILRDMQNRDRIAVAKKGC